MTNANSGEVTAAAIAVNQGVIDEILRDIYAATGQKVDSSDPVVIAALVHTQILQRTAADAAKQVDEAARRGIDQVLGKAVASAGMNLAVVFDAGRDKLVESSRVAGERLGERAATAARRVSAATEALNGASLRLVGWLAGFAVVCGAVGGGLALWASRHLPA